MFPASGGNWQLHPAAYLFFIAARLRCQSGTSSELLMGIGLVKNMQHGLVKIVNLTFSNSQTNIYLCIRLKLKGKSTNFTHQNLFAGLGEYL